MDHSRKLVSDALLNPTFPRKELFFMRKMMVIMERYDNTIFIEEEIAFKDAVFYFYALYSRALDIIHLKAQSVKTQIYR